MRQRKPKVYFDVDAPHKKSRRPFLYKFPNLVRLSHHPLFAQKKFTLTVVAIFLVVVATLGSGAYYLFANTRTLYPVFCSGDFADAASLSADAGGRARANASGQKLFCSFEAPVVKEHVPIVRATLVMRFDGTKENVEENVEESGSATDTSSGSTEVDAEAPAESTPEEGVSTPEEVEPVSEETEEAPPAEQVEESIAEPAPEPEPETPQEESVQSFFFFVAHAQEIEESSPLPVEEVVSEESVSEDVPVVDSEVTEEPPTEEAVVPEEEDTTEEDVEATPHIENIEETSAVSLSYTLDGVMWTDISSFSPRGNEVTFDLIVPTTKDLEKLVVRVSAENVVDEVAVTYLALRIETEAPLQDLLLEEEKVVLEGEHVYSREFTIDEKATHSCTPEPLTLDLSSATTTTDVLVRLSYGEDVGQGVAGIVRDVSKAALTLFEEESEAPRQVVEQEVTLDAVATTSEAHIAGGVENQTGEEPVETVQASSPEEILEEPDASIVTTASDFVKDALQDTARVQVGRLEVGNLPKGIDVRFHSTSSPYTLELFDTDPPEALLSARVYSREFAQQGSFSVPLIFTRTDGGVSDVVCQLNIVNKPVPTEEL